MLQVALHVTKLCTARCAGNLSSLGEELNSAKPSSCCHPCQRVLLMQEAQISSDSLITVFYNWWSNNVPHKLQKKILQNLSLTSVTSLLHLAFCIMGFFLKFILLAPPSPFSQPSFPKALFCIQIISSDSWCRKGHFTIDVLFSFELPPWNNKCQLHCWWWFLHHLILWILHSRSQCRKSKCKCKRVRGDLKCMRTTACFVTVCRNILSVISCHIRCCPLIVDANRAAPLQKGWWTSSKLAVFTTFLHSCALVDRRLRNS